MADEGNGSTEAIQVVTSVESGGLAKEGINCDKLIDCRLQMDATNRMDTYKLYRHGVACGA